MRDEQAIGLVGENERPMGRIIERPGTEDVPLVHGRVLASTRGYTSVWVEDPTAEYGRRLERVDVEEHLVDEPQRRQLLCMRLSRSLGARGKGTSPGRVPR